MSLISVFKVLVGLWDHVLERLKLFLFVRRNYLYYISKKFEPFA